MSDPAAWQILRKHLVARLDDGAARSIRDAAERIGVSHTALRTLLQNQERVPYPKTQQKVAAWLREQGLRPEELPESFRDDIGSSFEAEAAQRWRVADAGGDAALGELLELLSVESPGAYRILEAVLGTVVDPHQRQILAHAVVSTLKSSYLGMRQPIPPKLFELERRFLSQATD